MIDVERLKQFLCDGGFIYLDGTDEEIANALKYLFFESNIQNERQSWFRDYFTADDEWNGVGFGQWKFVLIDSDTGLWNMYGATHSKPKQDGAKVIAFSELASEFADDDSVDSDAVDVSLSDLYGFR